jgi:hypothetical protein
LISIIGEDSAFLRERDFWWVGGVDREQTTGKTSLSGTGEIQLASTILEEG